MMALSISTFEMCCVSRKMIPSQLAIFFLLLLSIIMTSCNMLFVEGTTNFVPTTIISYGDQSFCSAMNTNGYRSFKNPVSFPSPGWELLYFQGYNCPKSGNTESVSERNNGQLRVGYNHLIGFQVRNVNGTQKLNIVGKGDNTAGQLAIDRYISSGTRYFANITFEIYWGEMVKLAQIEDLITSRTNENNNNPSRIIDYLDWSSFIYFDDSIGHYFPNNIIIQDINTCYLNTFIILKNQEIYGTGSNIYKGLSLENETLTTNSPIRLNSLENLLKSNNDWIDQLYCGYSSVFIKTKSNRIIVFGRNDVNQLGLGSESRANSVIPIIHPFLTYYSQNISVVESVSFGMNFTLISFKDGSVFCAGLNNRHQCGLGINEYTIPNFVQIPISTKITKISTTAYASFFGTEAGEILSSGWNLGYVLGQNNSDENYVSSTPVKIENLKSPIDYQISRGFQLFHITYQNATASWAWGSNQFSSSGLIVNRPPTISYPTMLGLGNVESIISESISNPNECKLIGGYASSFGCTGSLLQRVNLKTGFNTTFGEFRTYCSNFSTFNYSTGYCTCNDQYYGYSCHLLKPEYTRNCNQSSMENFANGPNTCYCGGEGFYGSLCENKVPPRSIHSYSRLITFEKYGLKNRMFDFGSLKSGHSHSFVKSLLNNNRVYVFGNGLNTNDKYGSGLASNNMISGTIQISTLFERLANRLSVFITSIFPMKNLSIVLFSNGEIYKSSNTTQSGSNIEFLASNVQYLSCSDITCFFIKNDKSIYGIFDNQYNQLGLNDFHIRQKVFEYEPVLVSLLNLSFHKEIISIYPSNHFTLFVNQYGTLFGIGRNSEYQLGIGHNLNINKYIIPLIIENPISHVIVTDHVIFMKELNSDWKTMGKDILNIDPVSQYLIYPTRITNLQEQENIYRARGNIVITQTTNKFRQFVLNQDISFGYEKIVDVNIMDDDIILLSIPNSFNPPLCYNGHLDINGSSCICDKGFGGSDCKTYLCDRVSCSSSLCIGPNICSKSQSIPTNELRLFTKEFGILHSKFNVKHHAIGDNFAIFIDYDGEAKFIGDNLYGELGMGGYSITTNQSNLKLLTNNILLQPLYMEGESVKSITSGNNFIIVLSNSGKLYSVGDNRFGQLGHGDFTNRYFLTKIDISKTFSSVTCNSYHCIALSGTDFYGWGDNTFGQLCLDSTINKKINSPYLIPLNSKNVIPISKSAFTLGQNSTLFYTVFGEVMACGKIGSPTNYADKSVTERIIPKFKVDIQGLMQIPRKFYTDICLKNEYEEFYCFGQNKFGSLGFGHSLPLSGLYLSKHYGVDGGLFFFTHTNKLNFYYSKEKILNYYGNGELISNLISASSSRQNSLFSVERFNDITANDRFGYLITNTSHCFNRGSFSNGICTCDHLRYSGDECQTNNNIQSVTLSNSQFKVIDSMGNNLNFTTDMHSTFETFGNLPIGFNNTRNNLKIIGTFNLLLNQSASNFQLILAVDSYCTLDVKIQFSNSGNIVKFNTSLQEGSNYIYNTIPTQSVDTSAFIEIAYITTSKYDIDGNMKNQFLKVYTRNQNNDIVPINGGNVALISDLITRLNLVFSIHGTISQISDIDSCVGCIIDPQSGKLTSLRIQNTSHNYTLYPILKDESFRSLTSFVSQKISSIRYPIHETFNFAESQLVSIDLSNNNNLEQSASYFDLTPVQRTNILINVSNSKICDIPFDDLFLNPSKYNFNNTNMYCMIPVFDNSWCKPLSFRENTLYLTQHFASTKLSIPLSLCDSCTILNCFDFLSQNTSKLSYYFIYPNGDKVISNDFNVFETKRDENVDLVFNNFIEHNFLQFDYINLGFIYKYDSIIGKQELKGNVKLQYLKYLPSFNFTPIVLARDADNIITIKSENMKDFIKYNQVYCKTRISDTLVTLDARDSKTSYCTVRTGSEHNQNITVQLIVEPFSGGSSYKIGEFNVYVLNVTLLPNIINKDSTQYPQLVFINSDFSTGNFLSHSKLEFFENNQIVYKIENLKISYFNNLPISGDIYKQNLDMYLDNVNLGYFTSQLVYKPVNLEKIIPVLSFKTEEEVTIYLDRELSSNIHPIIEYRCLDTLTNTSFSAQYLTSRIICNINNLPSDRVKLLDLIVQIRVYSFNDYEWFTYSSNSVKFYHLISNMNISLAEGSQSFTTRHFITSTISAFTPRIKLNEMILPDSETYRFSVCLYNSFNELLSYRSIYFRSNLFEATGHTLSLRSGYSNIYLCADGNIVSKPLIVYVINQTDYDAKPIFGFVGSDTWSGYVYHEQPLYSDSTYNLTYSCALFGNVDNYTIFSTDLTTKIVDNYYITRCVFTGLNNIIKQEAGFYFSLIANRGSEKVQLPATFVNFIYGPKSTNFSSPFITHVPYSSFISTTLETKDQDRQLFVSRNKNEFLRLTLPIDCLLFNVNGNYPIASAPLDTSSSILKCDLTKFKITTSEPFEISLGSLVKEYDYFVEFTTRTVHYTYLNMIEFTFEGSPILEIGKNILLNYNNNKLPQYKQTQLNVSMTTSSPYSIVKSCDVEGTGSCVVDYTTTIPYTPVKQAYALQFTLIINGFLLKQDLNIEYFLFNNRVEVLYYSPFLFDFTTDSSIQNFTLLINNSLNPEFNFDLDTAGIKRSIIYSTNNSTTEIICPRIGNYSTSTDSDLETRIISSFKGVTFSIDRKSSNIYLRELFTTPNIVSQSVQRTIDISLSVDITIPKPLNKYYISLMDKKYECIIESKSLVCPVFITFIGIPFYKEVIKILDGDKLVTRIGLPFIIFKPISIREVKPTLLLQDNNSVNTTVLMEQTVFEDFGSEFIFSCSIQDGNFSAVVGDSNSIKCNFNNLNIGRKNIKIYLSSNNRFRSIKELLFTDVNVEKDFEVIKNPTIVLDPSIEQKTLFYTSDTYSLTTLNVLVTNTEFTMNGILYNISNEIGFYGKNIFVESTTYLGKLDNSYRFQISFFASNNYEGYVPLRLTKVLKGTSKESRALSSDDYILTKISDLVLTCVRKVTLSRSIPAFGVESNLPRLVQLYSSFNFLLFVPDPSLLQDDKVIFKCSYEYLPKSNKARSNIAKVYNNEAFECNMTTPDVGEVQIDLYIEKDGHSLSLNINSWNYIIYDGLFLQPSYGLRTIENNRLVNPFKIQKYSEISGINLDQYTKFNGKITEPNIAFTCEKEPSLDGSFPVLNCTIPILPSQDILSFKQYELRLYTNPSMQLISNFSLGWLPTSSLYISNINPKIIQKSTSKNDMKTVYVDISGESSVISRNLPEGNLAIYMRRAGIALLPSSSSYIGQPANVAVETSDFEETVTLQYVNYNLLTPVIEIPVPDYVTSTTKLTINNVDLNVIQYTPDSFRGSIKTSDHILFTLTKNTATNFMLNNGGYNGSLKCVQDTNLIISAEFVEETLDRLKFKCTLKKIMLLSEIFIVSKVELYYNNSVAENGFMKVSSGILNFIWLPSSSLSIEQPVPFAFVSIIGSIDISLSNQKLFVPSDNYVCYLVDSSTSYTEKRRAIYNSAGTLTCPFSLDYSKSTVFRISIYFSNGINDLVLTTSRDVTYINAPLEISYIDPFITYHLPALVGTTKDITYKVSKLTFIPQGLSCTFREGLSIVQVRKITKAQIQDGQFVCPFLIDQTLTSYSLITKLVIDLGSGRLLDVSNNELELMLYKKMLTWNINSYLTASQLNARYELRNYEIPQSSKYNLQQSVVASPYLKSQKISDLETTTLDCIGVDPASCTFVGIEAMVNKIPSYMTTAIEFVNVDNQRKSYIIANDLTLFLKKSSFNVSHISPYIADYRQSHSSNQNFLFTSTSLNAEDFDIICQFDNKKTNMTKNQFCVVKPPTLSNGHPKSGIQNITLSWNGIDLFSRSYPIDFIEAYQVNNLITFYSYETNITLIDNPSVPLPYSGDFSGYRFSIGIYDKNRLIGEAPCRQLSIHHPYLECVKGSISYFTDYPISSIVRLLINSQSAFMMKGEVVLYQTPTISSLSTNYFRINQAYTMRVSGRKFYQKDTPTLEIISNSTFNSYPTLYVDSNTIRVPNILFNDLEPSLRGARLKFTSGALITLPDISIYKGVKEDFTLFSILSTTAETEKGVFVVSNTRSVIFNIIITSTTFLNQPQSCLVKYEDGVISIVLSCTMSTSEVRPIITTSTPLMWYFDLVFPRMVYFSFSVDGGAFYYSNSNFKFKMIDNNSNNFVINTRYESNVVRFSNVPYSVLSAVSLSFIKIGTNGTNKQELVFTKSCESTSSCTLDYAHLLFENLKPFEYFEFNRIRINNGASSKTFRISENLVIFNPNNTLSSISSITVSHTRVQIGASTYVTITLPPNFSNDLSKINTVSAIFQSDSLIDSSYSVLFNGWNSSLSFGVVIDTLPALSDWRVSAIIFQNTRITVVNSPIIATVPTFDFTIQNQYQKSKASTRSQTILKVSFKQLMTIQQGIAPSLKISTSNTALFKPYTASIQIDGNVRSTNAISFTEMTVIVPPVSSLLNVDKSLVRFPTLFSIGFAFLDNQYVMKNILTYDDSIADPPIIVSVNPQEIPLIDERITLDIKASSLDPQSTQCIFRASKTSESVNNTIVVNAEFFDQFSIGCSFIPSQIVNELGISSTLEMDMTLRSNLDESKEVINIPIYRQLRIDTFSPKQGITTGEFEISFIGSFPIHPREEYFLSRGRMKFRAKFGIRDATDCTRVSSTTVTCKGVSNPISEVDISISRNTADFVKASEKFVYFGCGPGHEQSSFNEICKPCRAGYSKNFTGGPCVHCDRGFYSSSPGSLECTKCPSLQTTLDVASTSIDNCGCPAETYYYNIFINACTSCPKGASCPSFNTTYPIARSGYWHSNATGYNPYNFYECIPSTSCSPGLFGNCSDGYTGFVCGLCEDGFYRSSRSCNQCSNLAPLYLSLLAGGVALIALAFFFFSSIKVHHISSLSIALFFFQVNSMWTKFDLKLPDEISGLFTASSASTFNFDFIQFQCVFPIGFVPQWILKMLIPVMLLLLFVVLYLLGELRNIWAKFVGPKIPWKKWNISPLYDEFIKRQELESDPKLTKIQKLKLSISGLWFSARIALYKAQHKIIWTLTAYLPRSDMKKFLNNCIHSFITFLSLAYMYIIQTSADIFLCKDQADGSKNLEQAPHIRCFEGTWWVMFPFSVIYFILFGLGAAAFFIYSAIKYRKVKLTEDHAFIQRFKFLFVKFKPKYFYYESVITIRKLVFSVLYVFLAPLQVIALGFVLIFLSFVIHLQLVPYSKKMHNLIEYVTLVATLLTLFTGLIFFYDVESLQGVLWIRTLALVLTIIIFVLTSALLVLAVFWDIRTRKSKEAKKIKEKLNEIKMSIDNGTMDKSDDSVKETIVFGLDIDDFDDDPAGDSSINSKHETINDVFSNLFSLERRKKKTDKIKEKGAKIKSKITNKTKSSSEKTAGDTFDYSDQTQSTVSTDTKQTSSQLFQ